MIGQLSARERRLVAVLLLVAATALAWRGVIAPVIDGFAARGAERERLQARFAANTRLVASIPRLRRLAEVQQADAARFRIAMRDPVAAAELLKERLSAAVEGAGGETTATEDVEGEAGWVQAWVQARVTQRQLVRVLAELRNTTPYLVVASLAVSADRTGQPEARTAADRPLEVRIETAVRHAAP